MINPHLWLDPVLVKRMVPDLARALAEALPEHADAIEANAAGLDGKLGDLDAEFERRLAPLHDAEMITYHSAFDLLAARYGLTVAATLTPVESPGDVTSGRLAEVIRLIREHDVRAVFTEPQFPADRAAAIQRETGVEVLVLDPLGDPNQGGRDGYFALMRYNLETLVKGLGRDE
jgi:zinc transport system substrate-binding protein